MADSARLRGLDTVQFTSNVDAGTRDECCARFLPGSGQTCRMEIMATDPSLDEVYACSDQRAGARLRAGWQGSRACECLEAASQGYVNCKGLPLAHSPQAFRFRGVPFRMGITNVRVHGGRGFGAPP